MPFRLSTSTSTPLRQRQGLFRPSAQCTAWLRPALVLLLLLGTQCCAAARTAEQAVIGLKASEFLDAARQVGLPLKDPRWTATVLVPTNGAFRALEREHNLDLDKLVGPLLARIINYHVIPGTALSLGRLTHGQVLTTAQGQTVTVDTRSTARVIIRGYGAAGCVSKEVRAGNVAIFLIDAVIYPNLNPVPGCPSVISIALANSLTDFSSLASYGSTWGAQLSNRDYTGTCFIPKNTALKWGKTITPAQAQQIVANHCVRGPLLTDSNLLQDQQIKFDGGSTYTVDRMNKVRGVITLRSPGKTSVKVQGTYQACSAVVHIINGMLT